MELGGGEGGGGSGCVMVCSKFSVTGPGLVFCFGGGGGAGNETKKHNCLENRQSVPQGAEESYLTVFPVKFTVQL